MSFNPLSRIRFFPTQKTRRLTMNERIGFNPLSRIRFFPTIMERLMLSDEEIEVSIPFRGLLVY